MADRIAMQAHGLGIVEDRFPYGSWIAANAVGLGLAYGLFALFSESIVKLGASQDGVVSEVAAMAGLVAGGALFVILRQRLLAPHFGGIWPGLTAGIGFTAGFIVGFFVGGPPVDFMLGVIALGTIGDALLWRIVRHQIDRPDSLLLAGIVGWIAAAGVAVLVAVLAGEPLVDVLGENALHFVTITTLIGIAAGATGGAIEGHALRRRL